MNITYTGYIDLEGRFRCWGRCRAALNRNFSLKENKRPSFRGITAMTSRS
jgi:hypothetical protein